MLTINFNRVINYSDGFNNHSTDSLKCKEILHDNHFVTIVLINNHHVVYNACNNLIKSIIPVNGRHCISD